MSIRIRKESLSFVNKQRLLKGWNKTDKKWCKEAGVSESTLKRFSRREGISQSSFECICKAIDIADWENHVDWQSNNNSINSSPINQSKDVFTPSLYSATNKFTISINGTGVLNTDEIVIVSAIINQLKSLIQRFDYRFEKNEELISQPEISKSKYTICGFGIGIFTYDESCLVKEIFQTLKSFFANIFITAINLIPEQG